MEDYLKGLNESQFEAVTTLQGPLMVLAGAGSGKTRVLTMRIAHLITNGIDPLIFWRLPLPIRQQKK
jgi:DNA helicase-2/ATP-dependent DNA helicase PcrA